MASRVRSITSRWFVDADGFFVRAQQTEELRVIDLLPGSKADDAAAKQDGLRYDRFSVCGARVVPADAEPRAGSDDVESTMLIFPPSRFDRVRRHAAFAIGKARSVAARIAMTAEAARPTIRAQLRALSALVARRPQLAIGAALMLGCIVVGVALGSRSPARVPAADLQQTLEATQRHVLRSALAMSNASVASAQRAATQADTAVYARTLSLRHEAAPVSAIFSERASDRIERRDATKSRPRHAARRHSRGRR